MHRLPLLAVLIAGLCLAAPTQAAEVSFQGLGSLSADDPHSEAWAVSGDGGTVVGWSYCDDPHHYTVAMYWTAAGGMQPIVPDGRNVLSYARAASSDGRTIVGDAATGSSIAPWRWTESGGYQSLGTPTGTERFLWAGGVSADGRVAVGWYNTDPTVSAFRWTEAEGMVSLGCLPGYTSAYATDVSADGTIIVGHCTDFSVGQIFLWTAETGMVGLGTSDSGLRDHNRFAISADGTTVVGQANGTIRWTAETGIVHLPLGEACDVSADGNTVVGRSHQRAAVWDEVHGTRMISDVLTEAGVDMSGWTLDDAFGVSDDGLTIVGTGRNPDGIHEAWMAVIPEPATLGLLGAGLGAMLLRRRRSR